MKKTLILFAAALLFATVAFAQHQAQKPQPTPEEQILQALTGRSHHENDRVSAEGRISRMTREHDGYRVEIENDRDSYFVPQSRLGGRDLSLGIRIRLGGVFRGGLVYVDDFGWTDHVVVRGTVEHTNPRLGMAIVRVRGAEAVWVDFRGAGRRDLQIGDAVEIAGDRTPDGVLRADRVDRARRGW